MGVGWATKSNASQVMLFEPRRHGSVDISWLSTSNIIQGHKKYHGYRHQGIVFPNAAGSRTSSASTHDGQTLYTMCSASTNRLRYCSHRSNPRPTS